MRIKKLSITKNHIKNSVYGNASKCPVSLALRDYFKGKYQRIETLAEKVYIYKKKGYLTFQPNKDLERFIRAYDAHKRVQPETFLLGKVLIEEQE